MRRLLLLLLAGLLTLGVMVPADATIWFEDDFETAWTGDFAPGWIGAPYRHGDPPGAVMKQTIAGRSGHGLKLIADSVVSDSMFWAAAEVECLPHSAMARQYNPYISAWYYDELGDTKAGQIYAVPDWVNPYIGGSEDWTDVQFGARNSATDNYYYVAAGEGSPGWENTGVARANDWHHLKFQLSSADGNIHFYLDGVERGTSYRNDYTNMGTSLGLYTMFDTPLSDWGDNKPYTLWDDFEVGSDAPIPEPGTLLLLGTGLAGLAGFGKFRRKKKV